jgi:hypothetical protein
MHEEREDAYTERSDVLWVMKGEGNASFVVTGSGFCVERRRQKKALHKERNDFSGTVIF